MKLETECFAYLVPGKIFKLTSNSSVLITDYVDPLLINGLVADGFRVCYAPEINSAQTRDFLEPFEGLIVNTKTRVDSDLMEASSRLHFIARLGSGLDIIDMDRARERGIRVYRAAEANANAVAEHVFGMLLCLVRNLKRTNREMRELYFRREANRGTELEGKTLGIVGFGNVGSLFASKFASWNVRILAYDKYKSGFAEDLPFLEECDFEKLIRESDFISLHIPYNGETHHMVDKSFFSGMKQGAVLINTSRGKVVDTEALMAALRSGHLAGACLDVFENEHPSDFSESERELYGELWDRDDVIVSPHIGGWTKESKRKIADSLLEKIRQGVGE